MNIATKYKCIRVSKVTEESGDSAVYEFMKSTDEPNPTMHVEDGTITFASAEQDVFTVGQTYELDLVPTGGAETTLRKAQVRG